jgi:uncharacterized protein (TIGR02246 family)
MRRAFAVGLLGCALAIVLVPAVFASDATEIAARTQEFRAAWNRHNAKGMAAVWAPDGDLINPFGRVAKGRAAIEALFTDEQSTMMKGTTMEISEEATRMVSPTVAVDDWDATITGMKDPDGNPAPPLKNHVTVVLVKKSGTWWVAAARPVIYPPPPGK